MNIGQICTRDIVMADQEASLPQAASLMREQHVGGIERETGERAPLPAAQAPAVRIPAYTFA